MIPDQRGIGGKTRAALDTLKNKFVPFFLESSFIF